MVLTRFNFNWVLQNVGSTDTLKIEILYIIYNMFFFFLGMTIIWRFL